MNLKGKRKPVFRHAAQGMAVIALMLSGVCVGTGVAGQQEPEKKDEKKEAKSGAGQGAATDGFQWGLYEGRSEIEVGYRWVSDTAGNKDMYRSMVNLGEGPKLVHSNLSLRSKYATGVFDRLDLTVDNWGGEPYNTMRLNVSRSDLYELRADYRDLNYYNYIPTFDNPLLGIGKLFNQHGLDVNTRSTDLEFKLYPTRKIRPYFGYSRSAATGPGYTTYSVTGNEFVARTNWRTQAHEFRGGLQFELPRMVLSVEQGVRSFRDDTSVSNVVDSAGNAQTPFLGQPVTLNTLGRGYHDRGSMPIFKMVARATPLEMLKISARYVYSSATMQSDMAEISTGNLTSLENRLFYHAATDHFGTQAKKPSSNGAFSIEFTPASRVAILEQFDAKSFHVSGSGVLESLYLNASPASGQQLFRDTKVAQLVDSYLSYNLKRNQVEVQVELWRGLVARAGHRRTSIYTKLSDAQGGEVDSREASLDQDTAIVGVSFKPGRWMHLALDYENNRPDGALTRTSPVDYNQFKFDWKVGAWKHISASGRVAFVRNKNPRSDIDFRSHNRNYSFAVNYEPSERFTLSLDYSKSNIFSDIAIILPQMLQLDRSLFDERGHGVGGSVGLGIYRGSKLDLGYRGIINSGSFPLNYHQPYASLSVPLQNHLAFKSQWQWFGYNEKTTSIEDHRTHLVTFGLAYSY